MSEQFKSKGLVLKYSYDLEFGKDGANMLKDKELKSKQQEIINVEADWSSSQKNITK